RVRASFRKANARQVRYGVIVRAMGVGKSGRTSIAASLTSRLLVRGGCVRSWTTRRRLVRGLGHLTAGGKSARGVIHQLFDPDQGVGSALGQSRGATWSRVGGAVLLGFRTRACRVRLAAETWNLLEL